MDSLLRNVRPNIVQSIRAFGVTHLREAAEALDYHFLYANLAKVQSRQDILDILSEQYCLPSLEGKNFDTLPYTLTELIHKSGQQTGFIVVLEHLPAHAKFDKETREQFLDIFRDAAEYWAEKKISFRCFYSFSVALSANPELQGMNDLATLSLDKRLDVSPMALRMSSPFNTTWAMID